MMNDVVPVWLKPTRNALGILGGIPRREFTRDSIEEKVAATTQAQWPVHAVITNSTYDGLLYNTDWINRRWMSRHPLRFRLGAVHPFSSDLPGEKWYERRACCGKSDLRNAIDPQNAGGVIAGFADPH